MSKIIDGAKEALTVARCKPHQFKYVREHTFRGVVGVCTQCEGRFTAWPETIYYAEIMAAKGAFAKGRVRDA